MAGLKQADLARRSSACGRCTARLAAANFSISSCSRPKPLTTCMPLHVFRQPQDHLVAQFAIVPIGRLDQRAKTHRRTATTAASVASEANVSRT